jgi:XTP/dITP diphosphohydrolase
MREILLATSNAGKIPGIKQGLEGVSFSYKTLVDFPHIGDVEENAATMEGNAIAKAMSYAVRSAMLTIADDSGVEVDALDGRPGVKSARYVQGSDEDRYRAVLAEMENVPDEKRTGRYVAVIAVCDPQQNYRVMTWRGECEGIILREPRGSGGFGYDPIFEIAGLGKTFAELSIDELVGVSHRSKAFAEAREMLKKEFV